MSEAAIVLVVLGVGLGGGLLLYFAVRAEGRRRETMSRADAGREARRDTSEPGTPKGSDDHHG